MHHIQSIAPQNSSLAQVRNKKLRSLFYIKAYRTVVLKLFCMFYPFNKDDYQIYPQYIKWCSFIKKTKETIYISYN